MESIPSSVFYVDYRGWTQILRLTQQAPLSRVIAPVLDRHSKLLIGSGHLGRNRSQIKRGSYVDKHYYSVFNVHFVNTSFIFLF